MMFFQSLDPTTGKLPEPRRRGRDGRPGTGASLMVHSKNPKHVALARVEHLPIQQCGRSLLAIYIQHGRGKRCRSWNNDETIADLLPRSGGGSYSVYHVRRWRRVLEDMGLIRGTWVKPNEAFPHRDRPDVDGGGLSTESGGRIVEVNLEALVGLRAPWPRPQRGLGWQDAREAREAAAELRDELEAEPEPAAAQAAIEAAPEGGGVITSADGRVITRAHSSSDLSFASQNYPDPDRATSTGRETRAVPAPETHANAGSRDAPLEAARAAPPAPSPSGPLRPRGEREQRTNEEHARCQRLGAIPPTQDTAAWLASLVPKHVQAIVTETLGLRPPAASASSSRAAGPPGPAERAPNVGLLFGARELAPIGRNGERPPGWTGGGGRGSGAT